MVHGDDCTMLGNDVQLDCFRERMQERYSLKARGRLGPDVHDDKEIRILNRVIQWNDEGIWYEPDPRHAEFILRDLGLTGESKGLTTPRKRSEVGMDGGEELGEVDATRY